ncbi:unnamed protein product [Rhizoctonia solani]|uniref:Ubiquitin-like domain-containing protein n=1 Tax=Rhizoctonia solani TaxID=456999 RepID=A0A8H3HG19_9AGAM|nr:unnamed protein product [Rhizoctonia solani]
MFDGQPDNTDPQGQGDNSLISIRVVAPTGEGVFIIKRDTKLKKLREEYAAKVGKDGNTLRFLFDGRRVNDYDTPASLEMEDGDVIEAMVECEY